MNPTVKNGCHPEREDVIPSASEGSGRVGGAKQWNQTEEPREVAFEVHHTSPGSLMMIGYLEGRIQSLTTDHVVIIAGGVGYLVHIPLSTYYPLEQKETASLQIYTHVREDALALYGFQTADEKFAFEKLISISGIGPRLAQVILSGIDVSDLADAIVRGDSRRLSAIPAVGKKTSERMCLELARQFSTAHS